MRLELSSKSTLVVDVSLVQGVEVDQTTVEVECDGMSRGI